MSLTLAITNLIEDHTFILGRYHKPKRLREPNDNHLSLVFSAYDQKTDKQVVLKFLHPRLESDYARKAFYREAQLLFELHDLACVVPLIESCQYLDLCLSNSEGQHTSTKLIFHVTQQAQSDLTSYINSAQDDALETLDLFWQLCSAIRQLHHRGICHRDLKTCNCVLFPEQQLRLIDFAYSHKIGSARLVQGAEFAARYAIPQIDLHYAAPELHCGFGQDPLFYFGADFFSLGAILFELLTKQKLISFLYNNEFMADVGELFYKFVDDTKRETNYRKIIHLLKHKYPLPDLHEFVTDTWLPYTPHLNKLYQGLADLDYASRCTDFIWISSQIAAARQQITLGLPH